MKKFLTGIAAFAIGSSLFAQVMSEAGVENNLWTGFGKGVIGDPKFYGVENIIRIGSAGSYVARLNVRDVVLAEKAFSESTYALYQNGEKSHTLYPSPHINDIVIKKAEELGIECKMGIVHSSDVFYSEPVIGGWEAIRDRTQSDCVEMESYALFHNANVLGKNAACLLTISDSFVTKCELSAEERQNSFNTMMRLALETAIAL